MSIIKGRSKFTFSCRTNDSYKELTNFSITSLFSHINTTTMIWEQLNLNEHTGYRI